MLRAGLENEACNQTPALDRDQLQRLSVSRSRAARTAKQRESAEEHRAVLPLVERACALRLVYCTAKARDSGNVPGRPLPVRAAFTVRAALREIDVAMELLSVR